MPVAQNRIRRGKGRPLKPIHNPRQCGNQSSSYFQLLVAYGVLLFLDLILKFRLEYLYPITLLFQEVHNLWKCSPLSSLFFMAVTFSTDFTIYMMTMNQGELLFMVGGFLVWIQVVYSGENRFTLSTFMLACLILCLESFITYRNIRNDPLFNSDNLRPIAAHCIGYPVVSLGYCIKRYLAYLMRIRKQSEVESKNKFYYQLLYEALPPENYIHRSSDTAYCQLDPEKDEMSSENTESDTAGDDTEKELSWIQKMKDLLSDVACFTRTTTTLVQVKAPIPPQAVSTTTNLKSNSSGWSYLLQYFGNISIFSKKLKVTSTSSNGAVTSPNPSPKAMSLSPSVRSITNCESKSFTTHATTLPQPTHFDDGRKNSKSSKHQKSKDRESPKQTISPLKENTEIRRRKKIEDDSCREIKNFQLKKILDDERLLQIKTQDDFKKEEKKDDDKEELKRLQREIKKRLSAEIELRNKIRDLIQHEDFTREELENLQKSEAQAKGHLQAEKSRRQELEIMLKKEEDLRKSNDKLLAEERRKNQNTTEIDQAKLRIRQLESEKDSAREELGKKRDDINALVEERKTLEAHNSELEKRLHYERMERKKTQEKLEQEARVKMMLLQQLNKAHQDKDKLENEISRLLEDRRNYSPSLSSPGNSPNGSFNTSNGFASSFHQEHMDNFEQF